MKFPRASGILLHPSSLPGRFGIGDMGPGARRFIDFLRDTGQRLWQIMPPGPTGYGDSPYASFSAFAGNPLFISPEILSGEGLVSTEDLHSAPSFPSDYVDYGAVADWKLNLLRKARKNFPGKHGQNGWGNLREFEEKNAFWLRDYSLFMALRETRKTTWNRWEKDLIARDAVALDRARNENRDLISQHVFFQYLFFRQWGNLKKYANENGIRIIGDIPIFVASDSADVWAHPEIFQLDENGSPIVVAGVPPDYFSKTGQLWGNPLYQWDVLEQTGFQWWIDRFRTNLLMVDIIRLDHFRGFESCWEVPAGEKTAMNGQWAKTRGREMFQTLLETLGDVPIIAEDLGVITPEVEALRDRFGFPGMKILQFAFGEGPDHPYLPHNYPENCVVYTGTHDNDTTVGWYTNSSTERERDSARRYMKTDGSEIHWDMIRLAFSSPARFALAPMQDVLGLGGEARMNIPGNPGGNWRWRFEWDQLTEGIRGRLTEITRQSGR